MLVLLGTDAVAQAEVHSTPYPLKHVSLDLVLSKNPAGQLIKGWFFIIKYA